MITWFQKAWRAGPYSRAHLVCLGLVGALAVAMGVTGMLYLHEIVSHAMFAWMVAKCLRWMGILLIVGLMMVLLGRHRGQPVP